MEANNANANFVHSVVIFSIFLDFFTTCYVWELLFAIFPNSVSSSVAEYFLYATLKAHPIFLIIIVILSLSVSRVNVDHLSACIVWLFKLFTRVYEGLSMTCVFLVYPTIFLGMFAYVVDVWLF